MKSKKGRETPFGLCQESAGFLISARRICDETITPERYCLLAYYYLVGHSIELACKAILLKDGLRIDALRSRTFGHNLEALINELSRRGLVGPLSEFDVSFVRMLSRDYHARLYNYRQGGRPYKLLPPRYLLETASRLLSHCASFCEVQIDIDLS